MEAVDDARVVHKCCFGMIVHKGLRTGGHHVQNLVRSVSRIGDDLARMISDQPLLFRCFTQGVVFEIAILDQGNCFIIGVLRDHNIVDQEFTRIE